jgi:hypothetical protein
MRTVDTPEARAEDLCARINGSLGWRAANPEYRDGYTGAIVVRERGAQELASRAARSERGCPVKRLGFE